MPFSSSTNASIPVNGTRGPIFVDGPHFDIAFRLFHGRNTLVSLSGPSFLQVNDRNTDTSQQISPLAAKAASISLASFCPACAFVFDSFCHNLKEKNNKKFESSSHKSDHKSPGYGWFQRGKCIPNCPVVCHGQGHNACIRYDQTSPGLTLHCPPAAATARAALAKFHLSNTFNYCDYQSK